MVKSKNNEKLDRITITLGKGQRELLQTIADRNHATQAFVVRYALDRLKEETQQKKFRLEL